MAKTTKTSSPKDEMVLNKFIAHAGICSRRKAVELIKSGHIKVNGEVETNPACRVSIKDRVEYQGKKVRTEKNLVYLLMNKPKNVVTTLKDERGRKTVMDIIGDKVKERIYPVGRLDRNTTGLLLLTNDGDLAKKLSHPSHKVKKIYQVDLDRPLRSADLDRIAKGLELEDGLAMVDDISYIEGEPKTRIGIEIHIGKNRIIRRLFEHMQYEVVRLDRVYYGGLTKKDLKRGWFRRLTPRELIMLKHFS